MIVPVLLLSALGVVVLSSSDPSLAYQQGLFLMVGFILYFLIGRLDYRFLRGISISAYVFVLVLLFIVFVLGVETRGSIRWIPLGLFSFQPSELAKPVIVLSLAFFWLKRTASWRNILISFGIVVPFLGLVFYQPDLGTTLTLGFIWLAMLIASGVSFWKFVALFVVSACVGPIGWMFLQTYQRQRLTGFLFPWQDPLGQGFHIIQSMIAVGSGQLLGRGLGRGTQSRLQFLPEFRTDFIFAFVAEELGFFGAMIVILCYGVIFFWLYMILAQTKDRLGSLIVIGVWGMLFFQVLVNISMNLGIMPITGITLPLLSYGGSSIIATFVCLGLVSSVARFGVKKQQVRTFNLFGEV